MIIISEDTKPDKSIIYEDTKPNKSILIYVFYEMMH